MRYIVVLTLRFLCLIWLYLINGINVAWLSYQLVIKLGVLRYISARMPTAELLQTQLMFPCRCTNINIRYRSTRNLLICRAANVWTLIRCQPSLLIMTVVPTLLVGEPLLPSKTLPSGLVIWGNLQISDLIRKILSVKMYKTVTFIFFLNFNKSHWNWKHWGMVKNIWMYFRGKIAKIRQHFDTPTMWHL